MAHIRPNGASKVVRSLACSHKTHAEKLRELLNDNRLYLPLTVSIYLQALPLVRHTSLSAIESCYIDIEILVRSI